MKNIIVLLVALAVVFGYSVKVNATLIHVGVATSYSDEWALFYDDDLGITWLDYEIPSGTWQGVTDRLHMFNRTGLGEVTYSFNPGVTMSWSGDWRLPTTPQLDPTCSSQYDWSGDGVIDTSSGNNCTGSEMAHLHNVETGGLDLFSNFSPGPYWSGTTAEYTTPEDAFAYAYYLYSIGVTISSTKDDYYFNGLAVRPGEVSASVPEPTTLSLLILGLIGLGLARRRSRIA